MKGTNSMAIQVSESTADALIARMEAVPQLLREVEDAAYRFLDNRDEQTVKRLCVAFVGVMIAAQKTYGYFSLIVNAIRQGEGQQQ